MRRVHSRRGFRRDHKTYLKGLTFMSLEDAVRHYMSDGNVNLPQAPEGAYEYDAAPSADELRGGINASFDKFDAAVILQNGSIIQPVPVDVSESSVTPSPSPSPAPLE